MILACRLSSATTNFYLWNCICDQGMYVYVGSVNLWICETNKWIYMWNCDESVNVNLWIYEFVMISKAKRGRNTSGTMKGSTWPEKRTSGFVCEFVMNLPMWICEFVMISKAKRGRNTSCTMKGSTWPEKRTIEPASEKQLAWQWCCDNGMEWNPLHSWKVPVTF